VRPEYPRYAQLNNIVGTVEVELTVGIAGEVEDVRIIKSPHPSLTKAVEQAVRQWKFPAQGEKYLEQQSFPFR
jgi:TonB family protein